MIKIETKKEINKGIRQRRIVKVEAIEQSELPYEYTRGYPRVYFIKSISEQSLVVCSKENTFFLTIGKLIDEDCFQQALPIIYKAGERLKKINEKIKKEKEKWEGNESFLI